MILEFTVVLIAIAIAIFLIINTKRFLSKPLIEKWRTTAAEMGLSELEDRRRFLIRDKDWEPVVGRYRNHQIRIFEIDASSSAEGYDPYTIYDIEFANPATIQIRLAERSRINRFFSLRDVTDITLDDPDFDQQFIVRGNKESDIKAILESIIRCKIMSLEFKFRNWVRPNMA